MHQVANARGQIDPSRVDRGDAGIEAAVLPVGDNADDERPSAFPLPSRQRPGQLAPHKALAWREQSCRRFAEDDDGSIALLIRLVDRMSLQHSGSRRREEVAGHGSQVHAVIFGTAVRLDADAEGNRRNARRNVGADRGVLHAWQRAHRPQHFPDRRQARRQIEAWGIGQHQLHDEGAIRIGTCAVGHQPEQRARNQAGAAEEHDRDRYLSDDEDPARQAGAPGRADARTVGSGNEI
jgi:hypothetical protein